MRCSPLLTAMLGEAGWGGLQEGNASGGPWMRFPDGHCAKAGTSDTRIGVAPAGRA